MEQCLTLARSTIEGPGRTVLLDLCDVSAHRLPSLDLTQVVIDTTTNNGRYSDWTGNSGSRTYLYRVCEAGTAVCSAEVVVVF